MSDPFFVSVECKNGCGYKCRFIKPAAQHNLEAHETLFCPLRKAQHSLRETQSGSQILAESGQTVPNRAWPSSVAEEGWAETIGKVRTFETGATRDQDTDKLEYEGFLSPLVLKRYAEYMHAHRFQADGTLRAADNWQKGMPLDSYMSSGWRHFMDWWMNHRGYEAGEELEVALCALIFNASGYLHELLKKD